MVSPTSTGVERPPALEPGGELASVSKSHSMAPVRRLSPYTWWFLPAMYAAPSGRPFTPGAEIEVPAPTSASGNRAGVGNRHRRAPVRASNA